MYLHALKCYNDICAFKTNERYMYWYTDQYA